MGFIVGYLYSNYMCEYKKLYIVGGEFIFFMILVMVVEFRFKREVLKKDNLVI